MKTTMQWAAVGLLLGGLLSMVSCGTKCDASNCTGCCDSTGTCKTQSSATCGAKGSTCTACSGVQLCTAGVCVGGTGGGAAGGTAGGSAGGSAGGTAGGSAGGTAGGTAGGSAGGTAGGSGGGGGTSDGGTFTLLGTWDVTTTFSVGSPVQSVFVIAPGSLTITSGWQFTGIQTGASSHFDVFQGSAYTANATGAQTAAAFDGGAIPFNLGGTWAMTSSTDATFHCNALVSASHFTGSNCTGLGSGVSGMFDLAKSLAEASVFGDLGGRWSGADSAGETCSAEFNGQDFSFVCTGPNTDLTGSTTVHFTNGMFSGSSPNGVQFAGVRR